MCLSVEIPVHRCRYAKEASHSMTTWARSVNEEIRRVKLNGPKGGMKKGVWGGTGTCQYGRGKRRRQELHNEAAELI